MVIIQEVNGRSFLFCCTKELMPVELMAVRWWGDCDSDVDEDECIVFKMLMF